MRTLRSLFVLTLLGILLGSCGTHSGRMIVRERAAAWPASSTFDDELDPFAAPTWKECLPVAYVFVEHTGDPRLLGDALRQVLGRTAELRVAGAPFALYFDDPARVPLEQQRSRACVPIEPGSQVPAGTQRAQLPKRMVVFQKHAGAYSEAPTLVPGLMTYLSEHRWQADGPVREIYFVNPGEVDDPSQLVCEVQVPWTMAR